MRATETKASEPQVLPGEDLVKAGLGALARGEFTEEGLLVLIAGPRLRRLGIDVPQVQLPGSCEHLLYSRLEERLGPAAHSGYNSLLRRIVSFAHALEQEQSRNVSRSPK